MQSKRSFIETYQNLIKIPSISAFDGSIDQPNQAIIELLGNYFRDYGFDISIHSVPDSRGKFNLLARIGSGEGGLLLAGHSDTVPFDEGKWQQDPFVVKQQDDKLFGLGTCDMKGFFAFILEAIKEVPLQKLKKPLYVLATADEETSMAGARFFAQQQLIKPDMAIIGEPTELKPIVKHKGHMAHTLSVLGKAGHSSDPEKGVNAIEIMHLAIANLIQLKQDLARNYRDDSFSVPQATMNLGHIHGGDGENRICGHCQLNFDLRSVPGLSDNEVISQIDQALAPIGLAYPGRLERHLMYPTSPPFACKNELGIIELAEKFTGFSADNANYATEAPFINELGCDTLILGPGSIEQAHQPDEFISLAYVNPTVSLLRNMIKAVCF